MEPQWNSAETETVTIGDLAFQSEGSAEPAFNQSISDDLLRSAGLDILRATRTWIQYGVVGFALLCIVIGAVEALFGR